MKPILVNGFGRSGTTYLYKYLQWISNGKALYEPLLNFSIYKKIPELRKNFIKFHPALHMKPKCKTFYIYNPFLLRKFMESIKEYCIKETTLHFYLDESFIKENWRVYHIIRHPGDVFISNKRVFWKKRLKLYNALRVLFLFGMKDITARVLPLYSEASLYLRFITEYGDYSIRIRTLEEAFLVVWTITNYHAINSIDLEKQLIIYEKPDTYLKLPKFEEFEKENPLKIKKYRVRQRYEKVFLEISKKFGIEKEFKELLELFK